MFSIIGAIIETVATVLPKIIEIVGANLLQFAHILSGIFKGLGLLAPEEEITDLGDKAIQAEITARLEEIDRIAENAEFNGLQLMNGSIDDVINLQVGLYASESSQISLIDSLFQDAHVSALFTNFGGTADATVSEVAKLCSGYDSDAGQIIGGQADMLDKIDTVINEISSRTTTLGAAQNRIDSAIETIDVQTENITSSLSIKVK